MFPLVFAAFTACGGTADSPSGSPNGSAPVDGSIPPATSDGSVSAPTDASTTRDSAASPGPSDGGVIPKGDAAIRDAGPGDVGTSTCTMHIPDGSAISQWAHVGANGQLEYQTLPTGERLLDFSYAGYMGGGVALPSVAASSTLSPSGGDDTSAVQAAIDAVSKAPLKGGFRGAVALAAGTFQLSGTLTIAASGVVLRGAGSGTSGTTINVTGAPRTVITVSGTGKWATTGSGVAITDSYVPSGARTFHVADAGGLSVGQAVLVERPVTAAWVDFMQMSSLFRNDAGQTWIAPGTVIHADRTITSIAGDVVTVDAPLSDSFDAKYTSPSVIPYTYAGRIEQVGIEGLHVVVPSQVAAIDVPTFQLLQMDAVLNGWVHDVSGDDVMTGIVLGEGVKWVTIDGASISRTTDIDGSAGWPFQISVSGQQTLVARSQMTGTKPFPYATQARTSGPNVVLDMTVNGSMSLQPHQRWATGLLADGVVSNGGSIDFINRGYYGSGHGWTIGFGVIWNSSATTLTVEQPPGSTNWAIGSSGTYAQIQAPGEPDAGLMPLGVIDSKGTSVAPKSLYLAQLCERLGPAAVTNIGFSLP